MKSTFFFCDLDQIRGLPEVQGMMEKECETVTNPAPGSCQMNTLHHLRSYRVGNKCQQVNQR